MSKPDTRKLVIFKRGEKPRPRYKIDSTKDPSGSARRDGKFKLTIPVAEIHPEIHPADEYHDGPYRERKKKMVALVFPDPGMALDLVNNERAFSDFVHAVKVGLLEAYSVTERTGKRGRPVGPARVHWLWMVRGLYPHLLRRLKTDPGLAARVQASLHLVPAGRDRKHWTPSARLLTLAVLDFHREGGPALLGTATKELRRLGLRPDAVRDLDDPDFSSYADEALTEVIERTYAGVCFN